MPLIAISGHNIQYYGNGLVLYHTVVTLDTWEVSAFDVAKGSERIACKRGHPLLAQKFSLTIAVEIINNGGRMSITDVCFCSQITSVQCQDTIK